MARKERQVSDIHRKKSKVRLMSERTSRANGRRSAIPSKVEHGFARQKGPMHFFIHTIGQVRAEVKIGMANLVYNLTRLVWYQGRGVPA